MTKKAAKKAMNGELTPTPQAPAPPAIPTMSKNFGDPPDPSNDEDDDEDDDEEDGAPGAVKKGLQVTEDDLQKSIDALTAQTLKTPEARKKVLLSKAISTELTAEENTELQGLLGGAKVEKSLAEEVIAPFEEDEDLNKSIDVSTYLTQNHDALIKALTRVADGLESFQKSQQSFDLVLAKAVSNGLKLTKSMSEKLGVMASAPARAPKSQGVRPGTQVIEKGFANGAPPQGDEPDRDETLTGLDMLMQKSMREGHSGHAACGEDIAVSTANYESNGRISKNLMTEVKAVINAGRAAAH